MKPLAPPNPRLPFDRSAERSEREDRSREAIAAWLDPLQQMAPDLRLERLLRERERLRRALGETR